MKYIVWKTGHIIADTVAKSLAKGLSKSGFEVCLYDTKDFERLTFSNDDIHIAYGILRGTETIFRNVKHWFNVDNGYWGACHFDGNYRISYKGTQGHYKESIEADIDFEVLPLKKKDGYILIVPPSDYVCNFFGIDKNQWINKQKILYFGSKFVVKEKSDDFVINWADVKAVITFNSTLGVVALKNQTPVISDVNKSLIGNYFIQNLKDVDYTLNNVMNLDIKRLFRCMSGYQLTLKQIEQGEICKLIQKIL